MATGPCCYPWIGVALGLLGSIMINTGNNLMSLGMKALELELLEAGGSAGQLDPKMSSTWVAGIVVFVSGSFVNFASFAYAPQSLLASLEAVQFVTNVLFSKFVLGKEVSCRMWAGTALIVAGTVLAIVFSARRAAVLESVGDLLSLWANPLWLAYLAAIGALAVGLHLAYRTFERRREEGRPLPQSESALPALYATLSALFGSTSVVGAKMLAVFVVLLAGGIMIFAHWFFYVTCVAYLGLMVFWLVRLNRALLLYEPLYIIPLLQANFNFFAIVSGGIFFREFDYMETHMWVGFTSGVVVMYAGLHLLMTSLGEERGTEEGGVPTTGTVHEGKPQPSLYANPITREAAGPEGGTDIKAESRSAL